MIQLIVILLMTSTLTFAELAKPVSVSEKIVDKMGENLESLEKLINSSESSVRQEAIQATARSGSINFLTLMEPLLFDRDSEIQNKVLFYIGSVGLSDQIDDETRTRLLAKVFKVVEDSIRTKDSAKADIALLTLAKLRTKDVRLFLLQNAENADIELLPSYLESLYLYIYLTPATSEEGENNKTLKFSEKLSKRLVELSTSSNPRALLAIGFNFKRIDNSMNQFEIFENIVENKSSDLNSLYQTIRRASSITNLAPEQIEKMVKILRGLCHHKDYVVRYEAINTLITLKADISVEVQNLKQDSSVHVKQRVYNSVKEKLSETELVALSKSESQTLRSIAFSEMIKRQKENRAKQNELITYALNDTNVIVQSALVNSFDYFNDPSEQQKIFDFALSKNNYALLAEVVDKLVSLKTELTPDRLEQLLTDKSGGSVFAQVKYFREFNPENYKIWLLDNYNLSLQSNRVSEEYLRSDILYSIYVSNFEDKGNILQELFKKESFPLLLESIRNMLASMDISVPYPTQYKLRNPEFVELEIPKTPSCDVVTNKGNFNVILDPQAAPISARQFFGLANNGWFDQQYWLRVIPNFIAQSSFYNGNAVLLRKELSPKAFSRGAFTVPSASDFHSSSTLSSLVVNSISNPHNAQMYTHLGEVTGDGMQVVDKLENGDRIFNIRCK